jgi:pSer/pThr/pTyr-binding forkhead associated (FHA) protein
VQILTVKTIGRNKSCDLVVEHRSVSREHAGIELMDDDSVWLTDANSRNGLYLNRSDQWIPVRKITLCEGDRLRLGHVEVPLQDVIELFGRRARVKLGEKSYSLRKGGKSKQPTEKWDTPGASMNNPSRNPVTGQIEEDSL